MRFDTDPAPGRLFVQLIDVRLSQEDLKEQIEGALRPKAKLLEDLEVESRPKERVKEDLQLHYYLAKSDRVWMVKAYGSTQIRDSKPPGFRESYICAIDFSSDDTEHIRFHLMAIGKPKRTYTPVYIQLLGNESKENVEDIRKRFGGMLNRDAELRRAIRSNDEVWLEMMGSQEESRSIYTNEPPEFAAIDTVFVGGTTNAFNSTTQSGFRTKTWIDSLPFYQAEFDKWFAAESSAGTTLRGNSKSKGSAE